MLTKSQTPSVHYDVNVPVHIKGHKDNEDAPDYLTDYDAEADVEETANPSTMAVFVCLGIAHILMYSMMLVTCNIFDATVFPGTSWKYLFPQVKSAFLFVGFILSSSFAHRLSFTSGIFVAYTLMGCSAILFPVTAILFTRSFIGLWLCLGLSCLNSVAAAISRSKTLGVAFISGYKLTWAEAQGLGSSGFVAISIMAIADWIFSVSDQRNSTVIFTVLFSCCGVFQCACAFSYKLHEYLASDPYTTKRRQRSSSKLSSRSYAAKLSVDCYRLSCPYSSVDNASIISGVSISRLRGSPYDYEANAFTLIRLASLELLMCLACFLGTFIIWPGISLSWAVPSLYNSMRYGTYINFLYQLGDMAGRIFARWPLPKRAAYTATVVRLALLPPVFVYIAKHPNSPYTRNVVTHTSMMLVLAISNGYLFTVVSSLAGNKFDTPRERTRMAPLVALAFLIGILGGSSIAPAIMSVTY